MTKSVSKVQTPFQNLKILIILHKVCGLVSCKLINGRLKQGGVWNYCYCILWIILHCAYSITYYYKDYIAPPAEKAEISFVLSIVRYTVYFASLLPYHLVVVLQEKNFIKFSNKLETYDDKVTALRYQRKDNHIFTWLYFAYTFVTLTMKTYHVIIHTIEEEANIMNITSALETIIPNIVGTYCVFISCIFLDVIRQRFRHLNEVIVPQVSELPITGSQGEITIYDVRYLHGVLIDCAEEIDMLYGIGTLITFGSILLEFLSIIYLLIKNIEQSTPLLSMLDLSFQVIYIFAMYHFTAQEANRVEGRVLKYGLSFQNAKCRMEKIETMLYFYHKRFSFTAAQFFVLDLTILLSILSTVTTYITLLI